MARSIDRDEVRRLMEQGAQIVEACLQAGIRRPPAQRGQPAAAEDRDRGAPRARPPAARSWCTAPTLVETSAREPRAQLERFGFTEVYDYETGILDWKTAGLPVEGTNAQQPRLVDVVRRDVPTCSLGEQLGGVRNRVAAAGWDACVRSSAAGTSCWGCSGPGSSRPIRSSSSTRSCGPGPARTGRSSRGGAARHHERPQPGELAGHHLGRQARRIGPQAGCRSGWRRPWTMRTWKPGQDTQAVATARLQGQDPDKIHCPVWGVIGNLGTASATPGCRRRSRRSSDCAAGSPTQGPAGAGHRAQLRERDLGRAAQRHARDAVLADRPGDHQQQRSACTWRAATSTG